MKAGCVGQQYDVFGWVEMSHDQVARQDLLKGIKFVLVFRKPEEGASFSGDLK